jgi:hypothetical protein
MARNVWICDNCGTEHKEEAGAIACQESHDKIRENLKITGAFFRNQSGCYGPDLGFARTVPERVRIRFGEGDHDFGTCKLERIGPRGL